MFHGVKPSKAIKTEFTNRFIDNIYDDVAREIKSGFIKNTAQFQKQFQKDIEIIFLEKGGLTKTEWHLLDGISDDAVKFMYEYAKKQGVLDKVKLVIY